MRVRKTKNKECAQKIKCCPDQISVCLKASETEMEKKEYECWRSSHMAGAVCLDLTNKASGVGAHLTRQSLTKTDIYTSSQMVLDSPYIIMYDVKLCLTSVKDTRFTFAAMIIITM